MRWLVILAVAAVAACQSNTSPGTGESNVVSVEHVDDDGPFDPKMAEEIGALFGRVVTGPPGATKRAVFLKPHGCAKATFTVADDLPAKMRLGLFAENQSGADAKTHAAWVRISSDTSPTTRDGANNTIGFSVKVLGVPGRKVLPGEESAATHDFLLQNHPVFFTDTASDFLDFTRAIFAGTSDKWLADHPTTGKILDDMKHPVENVLGTRYHSTTPYRFGEADYAKYSVAPCAALPPEAITGEANYLRARMERDVAAKGACFQFAVQLRGDAGDAMPLDRATVLWSEEKSPPIVVAKIDIAPQDILANDTMCENMSFTGWHALPEHQPVGSVNKARGIVYKAHADNRRKRNGVSLSEPE